MSQEAPPVRKNARWSITEKNCYIDVGYELTQGEFSPLGDGENVTSKQKICRKVDLSRGKIIKIFYPDSQVYI